MATSGTGGTALLAVRTLSSGNADSRPRSDVELLAALPGTRVVDPPRPGRSRRLEELAGADVRHALAARRTHPDCYLSFTERLGAPAALLDRRARHVCVAHNFNRQRRLFEQATHWMRRSERIVVVSRRQRELVVDSGVAEDAVVFLPDYVDTAFFDPARAAAGPPAPDLPARPFALAVGQEQRDHGLVLGAVQDTGLDAVLIPSSSWVTTSGLPQTLPPGVTVRTGIPYAELRALYAAAAVVVVAVRPGTEYAAGVNGLLEGLAMGKPVVVTDTPGLRDHIDERFMQVVPAGDRGAAAEAVRTALAHGDDPARHRAVREHAVGAYTVERYAEDLRRLVDGA